MWSFLSRWLRKKGRPAGDFGSSRTFEAAEPLYVRDLEGFLAIVKTEDPKARVNGLPFDLMDFALCEIIRYGVYNRPEMIGDLRHLYPQMIMQMPEDRRWELYQHVNRFVQDMRLASVNAYLPFICDDDSLKIASTAVIDFALLGPLVENDPMTCVRGVVELIENGQVARPGAAFGGLLNLGDRRVVRLLLPLRDSLARPAVNDVAKANTGVVHAATVEFYLDWLETIGNDNEDLFGAVASGLTLHRRVAQFGLALTGGREFPATPTSFGEQQALTKPVPLAEYTRTIAERLYALERMEAPPRIMPHVLAEWDLLPSTDPSETASVASSKLN